GAVDSAHSWYLHRGATKYWKQRAELSSDISPKLEAEDTEYGFRYAAIRKPNAHPESEKYVRVTLFVVPTTAFIPRPLVLEQAAQVQIHVPMDDRHSMFYGVFFSQNGLPVDRDELRESLRARRGPDLDDAFFSHGDFGNTWRQDRAAMKAGSWIGIQGFPQQDIAVQESMGPLVDRTREHLGTSDVAIIRMRRRMLEAVGRWQRGETLVGQSAGIRFDRLRSEQGIIPIDRPWQSVGAFAGEYAHT
ncbi:MAG TPA: hypothetical protein VGP41_12495, partial [Candidatus Lustribacter sp.]|nr:hypothetical protein [Candidatus Lustribacter sp.]